MGLHVQVLAAGEQRDQGAGCWIDWREPCRIYVCFLLKALHPDQRQAVGTGFGCVGGANFVCVSAECFWLC